MVNKVVLDRGVVFKGINGSLIEFLLLGRDILGIIGFFYNRCDY